MNIKQALVLVFSFSLYSFFAVNAQSAAKIELKNTSKLSQNDIIVKIGLNEVKKQIPAFNLASFAIKDKETAIPAEIIENYCSEGAALLVNVSLAPDELKTLSIVPSTDGSPKLMKRTQAHLGEKKDYKRVDNFYKEGKFVSVPFTKVAAGHFAHDALYQFEGPGWESDKIGYRFYLDNRNRTDIFGKTTNKVVLNTVGIDDLDSGNEGYQNPQPWGMDIFKVGNSLGIGSIATMDNGKVVVIEKTDSVTCKIANNQNLFSKVTTNYYGWSVADKKYDLTANLSIVAGSRLTKNELIIKGALQNICTGLAKHDSTDFIKSADGANKWGYIALYGSQARSFGNLGIVVFYKKSELISLGDDKDSYLVQLKPENGKVVYYFAAAWDREPNGIKTKADFIKYLNETAETLENTPTVSISKTDK